MFVIEKVIEYRKHLIQITSFMLFMQICGKTLWKIQGERSRNGLESRDFEVFAAARIQVEVFWVV
jgi:hypothetical protein